MDEELKDCLSYLASEKGLAQNSIEAYSRDLCKLISFLKTHNISTFDQVVQDLIISFLASLKDQNYADTSVSRALIAIKVLFKFLKREKVIKENVAHYLESPKLWQTIPGILSYKEIQKLLMQPDLSTERGCRDRAILELLYSCGLRVSEACSLKVEDVDDQFIRVSGKGGKERLVPISGKAIRAIDRYLNYRNSEVQALFLTGRGRPIDRILVWNLIKRYAKKAGIEKNISPHTLRHSFATHLLDNGADLRVIQEMMGHANISSTDRYLHTSTAAIQRAFNAYHPRG